MAAQDLALVRSRAELNAAAVARQRVRIRGVVAETGDGYSGTYRNVWLRIAITATTSVRVTASPSTALGTTRCGSTVELAVGLTGLVDVADDVFYAKRAQLLGSTAPTRAGE